LSEDGLNADLAMALQLPVLLVADNSLGVLNQVLLNAEAIDRRDLDLSAVVLNNLGGEQQQYMDNAADLQEKIDCAVYINEHGDNKSLPDELVNSFIAHSANQAELM
jgi:dethiobiotin synthetase